VNNLKPINLNTEFYNQLAADYDQMISFEKAVRNKRKILAEFINPDMKFAADLGCGSGVDSIALSKLGLKVDAFDPSSEMTNTAKENAIKENLRIAVYDYPIDSIPEKFNNKFDFAVSLGNTFANIDKKKFYTSIEKCFYILKQGGTLLIQVLNYEKIMGEKQRIVNITKGDEHYFVRFYDFIDSEIIFNILIINSEKPSRYKLISTKLFPYNQNDFYAGLEKAGFTSIEFFADFKLSTFNTKQSTDLIIRATKNQF
jgi:ubiquinone/menaquinone biosynthesis C-methylase UbiE